jgi:ornithine cyclodeaminase
MKIYTESEIGEALDFPRLIEALKTGFTEEYTIPKRMHLNYQNPEDRDENTLLLMPAVQIGKMAGVTETGQYPRNILSDGRR